MSRCILCNRDHDPALSCPTHWHCVVCGEEISVFDACSYYDKETNTHVEDLCCKCATNYQPALHQSAVAKVFNGPAMGVLCGLGLSMIVVLVSFLKLGVAILSDMAHSLASRKAKR